LLHFFSEFFLHAAPLGHLGGGEFALYGSDACDIFVGGISLDSADGTQFCFYLVQVGLIHDHFIEFGPVLIKLFGLFLKSILDFEMIARRLVSCLSVMASSFLYLKIDSSPFSSAMAVPANESANIRLTAQHMDRADLSNI
jgi:hypothetical protein